MEEFQERIWEFYREHGRHDLPWRTEVTPYGVLVSEVMLQQTQVSRVWPKYEAWIRIFPDLEALAGASTAEVIGAWQGLGYNRRALRLREAASMVVNEFEGKLPRDPAVLVRLPGIGPNTAGSIAAFAYDEPVVFIETNIRRVFIHHLRELAEAVRVSDSSGQRTSTVSSRVPVTLTALAGDESSAASVHDNDLLPLIEASLDREHPREWYWALMDYGADLTKRVENPNRRSKHYAVQSQFEGSLRQIRGAVLRQLLDGGKPAGAMGIDDERLPKVLETLVKEGFIIEKNGTFALAK